jgi:Reverse transcriptase (RNA-dependent DNA polymerase)
MYRLWDPVRKKPFKCRDVTFKENEFLEASAFENISQDFSPLEIEFNDFYDEPEDFSNTPNLVPGSPIAISAPQDDFITPKHPARPQYRPSPSATSPVMSTNNRYALLAPIPSPPVPHNNEQDHESDSDDDDDLYGLPITPTSSTPDSNGNTPPLSPTTETGSNIQPTSSESSNQPTEPTNDNSGSSSNAPTSSSNTSATLESVPKSTNSNPYPSRNRNPSRTGQESKETEEFFKQKRKSRTRAKVISTNSESAFSAAAQHTSSFEPPNEPKSIEEALASPKAKKWYDATVEEIDSVNERGTWTLVPRPSDRHVLNCKFIYKLKDPHTSQPRHKARLVAQGYTEIPGVDYTDTFAPVAKSASVRSIFAISATQGLHVHNFDVKTAYLYSTVKHESYIEQPLHFEVPGFPRDEWVYQINKGLYGRHDSGHLWYNTVHNKFKDLHFIRSDADECVFILDTPEHDIIVAVYVDDFLVAAKSLNDISWLHSELNKNWETRDLGPVKRFLGIDVHRPDPTGPIFINQGTYARQMLHEFGMQNCNPVKTPMDPSVKLHKRRDDESATDGELYRKITGKVMHMAIYTRPDLALASSKLSQFNSDPSETHMQAAKHILRYINGTLDHGILFSRPNSDEIDFLPTGFCDASFDTDPDDSKSTSGWIYMLANGAISWASNKQSCVALSTMESEYMAMSEAAKEAIFFQNLLESLNLSKRDHPILLKTDSQPAYDHIKNNINHSRTKHIKRRHHFIREVYQNGEIDIERIPSEDQTADILTKPLSRHKHEEAIKLLNLQSIRIPTDA